MQQKGTTVSLPTVTQVADTLLSLPWTALRDHIQHIAIISGSDADGSATGLPSWYPLKQLMLLCAIKGHRYHVAVQRFLLHLLVVCFTSTTISETDEAALLALLAKTDMSASSGLPIQRLGFIDKVTDCNAFPPISLRRVPVGCSGWSWASTPSVSLEELIQWVRSNNESQPLSETESPQTLALVVYRHLFDLHMAQLLARELRGQMMTIYPARRWAMVCKVVRGDMPLVILCGGTSGSGKSTVASLLAAQLHIAYVISTDTIRQVLRKTVSRSACPELFVSTYEAHTVARDALAAKEGSNSRDNPNVSDVIAGYTMQSSHVLHVLDRMIERFVQRRQSVVVEGAHLLTAYMDRKQHELMQRQVVCVPVLVTIAKETRHRERFSTRAKCMTLVSRSNKYVASFQHIRLIQNYLQQHALGTSVLIVNNTNLDRSLMLLHCAVLDVLERIHFNGSQQDTAQFDDTVASHTQVGPRSPRQLSHRLGMTPMSGNRQFRTTLPTTSNRACRMVKLIGGKPTGPLSSPLRAQSHNDVQCRHASKTTVHLESHTPAGLASDAEEDAIPSLIGS